MAKPPFMMMLFQPRLPATHQIHQASSLPRTSPHDLQGALASICCERVESWVFPMFSPSPSHMEVSWVIGVPPVIIQLLDIFRLGFSRSQKPSSYCGTPIYGKPHMWSYPPHPKWSSHGCVVLGARDDSKTSSRHVYMTSQSYPV